MAGCYDCGVEYSSPDWIEAVVPDAYWRLISPTAPENPDGGLLCFRCMRLRFEALGFGVDKLPVPCRFYVPGGAMLSAPYAGFDGDTWLDAAERKRWMALAQPECPIPANFNNPSSWRRNG
jgi:hypothetical protein